MLEFPGIHAEFMSGQRARSSVADVPAVPKRRGPLLRLFAWMSRWRNVQRDEVLLLRQSDYMLRDIGLGRAEIHLAVRGRDPRRR